VHARLISEGTGATSSEASPGAVFKRERQQEGSFLRVLFRRGGTRGSICRTERALPAIKQRLGGKYQARERKRLIVVLGMVGERKRLGRRGRERLF